MHKSLSEKTKNDMHNTILESALVIISSKGYTDATINDIAEKASCNPVTIFRHFDSKEALFIEMIKKYHAFDFDAEELEAKLSYLNLHSDFRIMANYFFDAIYKNIHILRIYINDSHHFEITKKYAWYMPVEIKNFVIEYLSSMYPKALSHSDIPLIAEQFTCYIVRTCLQLNVQEKIEENSRTTKEFARGTLETSVNFIVDTILMLVSNVKQNNQN